MKTPPSESYCSVVTKGDGSGALKVMKGLAAFVAVVAFSCAASTAQTVNVDFNSSDGFFGTYTGTAAAPDGGTMWNGVVIGPEGGSPLLGSVTSGPLATSTGDATPFTVTLGNFHVYEADERAAALATSLLTDFAYQQTLGPGGPDSTFSINNLAPGFTYDLYLYAQNGGYGSTATIFTIDGFSQIADNIGNVSSFTQNVNYVLYEDLVPDAFGTIFGTFNDSRPADNAAFNGLQIVVPEPAALSLLASAGLLVLRRRKNTEVRSSQ